MQLQLTTHLSTPIRCADHVIRYDLMRALKLVQTADFVVLKLKRLSRLL